MLPVGRQDITRGSLKALVYLVLVSTGARYVFGHLRSLRWPRYQCTTRQLAHNLAPKAIFTQI